LKHTVLLEPNDTTWMEALDKILNVLNKHYGYNVKEQVYYSVTYPLNELDENGEELAGYGRSLNDELFQKLLLTHPELYEAIPFGASK
jgi:hypothetical protein